VVRMPAHRPRPRADQSFILLSSILREQRSCKSANKEIL
jgi:hypothetical protein